ncbi:MAG: hypothetical protein AB7T31_07110 [Gemmatimonadales bacterium]
MPYRLSLMIGVCVWSLGCGSDSLAPTLENIAGTYEATYFVGGGNDVLAAGGSLTLILGADGSVAGSLFVPAGVGGPFTADMDGTFTVSGNTLVISQPVDTFVKDATWTWDDGELTGESSAAGVLVRLER